MKPILLLFLLALASASSGLAQFGNATRIRGLNIKSPLACASDGFGLVWVAASLRFECITFSVANGVTTTAGATFGAFTYDFTGSTVGLPSVFLRSDTGWTMTAGQKIVAVPSASTPGFRVAGGAIPTTNPHTAGDWMTDPAGRPVVGDGLNDQYLVTVAGSGITPPAAPTSGQFAKWGAGFTQTGSVIGQSDLPATTRARGIAFAIGDPSGSALAVASTTTDYVTVPFACTISAYNLLIDAGTITVKFWKVATGTAIPTSGNSISTSGVGISSGTAIHSATVSDFTSTTVTANDIVAMNVTAVATAKYVSGVLECTQ